MERLTIDDFTTLRPGTVCGWHRRIAALIFIDGPRLKLQRSCGSRLSFRVAR